MRGALPVVHAVLAMAEGPAAVGSAGGADEATVAVPEALGPGAYGRAGGGADTKGHRIARPGKRPTQCGEKASERSLRRKERGHRRGKTARGRKSGHRKNTTERGVLTSGDRSGRDVSGHAKEVTLRGAPTSWGPERESPARKGERCDRMKSTPLWRRRGGTSQDTEREKARGTYRPVTAVRIVVKPGVVASMKSELLGCSRKWKCYRKKAIAWQLTTSDAVVKVGV